jgi:translation elongation factor EF-1alpha
MLELLDNMDITDRDYNAPLMMPIADKFKVFLNFRLITGYGNSSHW